MKIIPSLKQLEYLDALARTRHFAKAAALCNVTPSTLSAGMRDLETTLGVALAERTKRRVMMTPLGLEIASKARDLLQGAEQIMDMGRSRKQPLGGDLALGVIPTIGPFMLPNVIAGLHQKYPDLRLYLREEKTEMLLDRLRQGELDAALIAMPYDIEGLSFRALFEDEFLFACLGDHELAKRKQVTQDDIAAQSLLLLQEGHCLRGHALSVCDIGQKQNRSRFEATSLHTVVQMVATGLGVTLLPKMAIDAGIVNGTGIQLIPMAQKASRGIGLVWRGSTARVDEFNLLADELAGG